MDEPVAALWSPRASVKTILRYSGVILLLLAGSSPCAAMMGIAEVTKERAKELGIEVRSTPNGSKEVWVELEFNAKGALKDFDHVSLELHEGGKFLLGYAPLKEKRTDAGSVIVGFLANRAYLDKVSLSLVVGRPEDRTGYELRLKEFVE